MESSGGLDLVIGGSAHHWCLDRHCLLVVAHVVVHVGPDPKRAGIVRTLVIADDELLTILVVVPLGGWAELLVRPVDRLLVDLCAAIADLISLVEVEVLSGVRLDVLP